MPVMVWIGFAERVSWIRRKHIIVAGRREIRLIMI
jgi:hypothetical protein